MRTLALMFALLCLTCSGIAQSVPNKEKEALKDSQYALRRFEEVTARIDFSRLKAPGTTIGRIQEVVLNMTQTKYVNETKIILKRFDGTRKPTSVELLLIMADLERAANALLNLSGALMNFQDPQAKEFESSQMNALAEELSTASDTTYEAMTEIFVVLQDQIGVEEDRLKMCAQIGSEASTKKANTTK